MSIENAGYSAGGGLVGVILSYLGFKQRLDRMQAEIDSKVPDSTFNATIEFIKEQHKSMDKKLDIIIEHSARKRENY